jgi:hypothetical protein
MPSKDPVVGVVVPLEGKGESEDRKTFTLEQVQVRLSDKEKLKQLASAVKRALACPHMSHCCPRSPDGCSDCDPVNELWKLMSSWKLL